MEYQKIANLIDDNTLNQPSKFRTRNWIEINDESRGTYNVNSQIKFKTTMLKCDVKMLVYVIIVMHIFLLRELLLLIALLLKVLLQIILIKK